MSLIYPGAESVTATVDRMVQAQKAAELAGLVVSPARYVRPAKSEDRDVAIEEIIDEMVECETVQGQVIIQIEPEYVYVDRETISYVDREVIRLIGPTEAQIGEAVLLGGIAGVVAMFGARKILQWLLAHMGMTWVLNVLGIVAFFDDRKEVTVYSGDKLRGVVGRVIGQMSAETWAAFKESMRRNVRDLFRAYVAGESEDLVKSVLEGTAWV